MAEILLTDPRDLAFCRIAQGAFVNDTTMPSGYVTPSHRMTIVGKKLVTVATTKKD